MVNKYLEWSKGNKDSWQTDHHRAKPLIEAFQGKLLTDTPARFIGRAFQEFARCYSVVLLKPFVDNKGRLRYFATVGQRIYYNTTMDEGLMKELKVPAIQLGSSPDAPHSVIQRNQKSQSPWPQIPQFSDYLDHENVQVDVKGSNLIITSYIAQNYGPNKSGKTAAVVSALDKGSALGDESNPIMK